MSPKPARQFSSSEEDSRPGIDERKRKRMESNRESARRSRMRKQQRLDDLLHEVARLKNENSQIEMQISMFTQQYLKVESNNSILRTQVMELTDRLRYLNSVLRFIEQLSGMSMEIQEIPDPLLKPWQLPCQTHPIIASANMLQ
ncbi:Ocs element-binding factor 1 [Apostasia shenzhenica]|uniref:Ocs element-binding factor 1 n=1 Tax=Apostasia shenzhenica TaxID=1088818 RepID=A0A2I0AJU9_9ASPA|nr:Ocs element-binding factor 1 [Apostasia shenzhenica]